jgi:hypothetical protein
MCAREHAYLTDYGTKRADYIDAFLAAADWEEAERRFGAGRRPGLTLARSLHQTLQEDQMNRSMFAAAVSVLLLGGAAATAQDNPTEKTAENTVTTTRTTTSKARAS